MGSPVPKVPTLLIGVGLQVPGWQMAVTAAAPGKAELMAPAAETAISCGWVEV